MHPLAAPELGKKTILIVDDLPMNLEMIRRLLENHGFGTDFALCGEEAIERAELVLPSLILLDVMMPGIGGFETCRRLKASSNLRDIPVIFMTGRTETADKLTGFELGAVDYVTKPLNGAEVLARIATHLTLHALRQQLQEQNTRLQGEITAREQLQAQLVQSEKLASIGQLAAGVAHEINNPIGYIFSNFGTLERSLSDIFEMISAYEGAESQLAGTETAARLCALRERIDLDYLKEDLPKLMVESKDGIQRVRRIVQDLKDFSRVDSGQQWEWVDLHPGIDSTLNIVGNEIKYKADVVKQYGRLPEVECLASEMNQIFMNLLINAAHAIGPERGTITICTGAEGGEVWVEVKDNGCGIPEEHLARIFDPFFTTKPAGKGTGLGLSLAYGIAQKHGGRISVDSEVGRGSTFRVTIPATRAA